MSDLVNRLRGIDTTPIHSEAADAVERLVNKLRELHGLMTRSATHPDTHVIYLTGDEVRSLEAVLNDLTQAAPDRRPGPETEDAR